MMHIKNLAFIQGGKRRAAWAALLSLAHYKVIMVVPEAL